MDEDKRRKFLKEFNNFNFLLLSVTAIIGIGIIVLHLLGYDVLQ